MKIFTLVLLLSTFIFMNSGRQLAESLAQPSSYEDTPKLVIGIIVDQMRPDYISRYWDKFSEGGFKRLVRQGFVFNNAHYGYMPTYTGPGYASVYTGTTPAVHGIIGNSWYNREMKRYTHVTEDPEVTGVGTDGEEGLMSPRWLLTTTFGDELRLHTNMRSKVVGLSLKDRGSILPAGHVGDAYWLEHSTGRFISSSFYKDELPGWVRDFNERNLVGRFLSQPWETLHPIEAYIESIDDDNPYEGAFSGQERPLFPHNLPEIAEEDGPVTIASTPFGDELLFELAYAVIEGEELGGGETPDLLSLALSSPDYVGHQFGPASKEIQDLYLRLDMQLERFLNYLDERFGTGNVLIFLTSDHGAVHVPEYLQDLDIPASRFDVKLAAEGVREFLKTNFDENFLLSFSNQQVFLDRARMEAHNLDVEEVQKRVVRHLMTYDGIAGALTRESLTYGEFSDGIRRLVQRGYNQKRSGDVAFWLDPQWIPRTSTGTTHGSPYAYDTHAPMIWYGWNVTAGRSAKRVYLSDIASTVATFLHSPLPSGNTGNPMNDYMK